MAHRQRSRAMVVVATLATLAACGAANDDVGAAVVCEDFVKQNLRAPTTAGFPVVSDQTINSLQPDVYSVSAHVDSENGFGAQIRTPYTCTVRLAEDGETWRLEGLTLDGKNLMK